MSVQDDSVLGGNFDALIAAEKESATRAAAEEKAIRSKNFANRKDDFRKALARAIASFSSETNRPGPSICVTYWLDFEVEEFIDELVARGHYVTNWYWAGGCYRADLPAPVNYLEVFRVGVYAAGSQDRLQLSSCQLL